MRDADPLPPVFDLRPLESVVAGRLAVGRAAMLVLSVFAAAAVVLAMVGLYGVMSYSVSYRTRELGVRLALGAAPSAVVAMLAAIALAATWLPARRAARTSPLEILRGD